MRYVVGLICLTVVLSSAFGFCYTPTDFTQERIEYTGVTLCRGEYTDITFYLKNATVDCNGSSFIGNGTEIFAMLNGQGNIISNCEASNYSQGIHTFNTSWGNLIVNNTLYDMYDRGLNIYIDNNTIIRNNTVTQTKENNLELSLSENITIENNYFSQSNYNWSSGEQDDSCVSISRSTNITFHNNTIFYSNSTGLDIYDSHNSSFDLNNISQVSTGLSIDGNSSSNLIFDNQIKNNYNFDIESDRYEGIGVSLNGDTDELQIYANNITDNCGEGAYCFGLVVADSGTNINILGNNISNHNQNTTASGGIVFNNFTGTANFTDNIVYDNGFSNGVSAGVIVYLSNNINISNNNFSNNQLCDVSYYDTDLLSTLTTTINDTNNFISSSCRVKQLWHTSIRVISNSTTETLQESFTDDSSVNDIEGYELQDGSDAYIYYIETVAYGDILVDNTALDSYGISGNHTGNDLEFIDTDCLSAEGVLGITTQDFSDNYVDLSSSDWFCVRDKSNPERAWSIEKLSLTSGESFTFSEKLGASGANITLRDDYLDIVFSRLTDYSGRVKDYISEFSINGDGVLFDHTPHNITVSYGTYFNTTSKSINTKRYTTLTEIEFYLIADLISPIIDFINIIPSPVETSNLFEVIVRVTDNNAVANVLTSITGIRNKSFSLSAINASYFNGSSYLVNPGEYSVEVVATDDSSNSDTANTTLTVISRTTPPNVSYCCNITSIGLVEQPYILSEDKIRTFMFYDYSCTKNLVGLWSYDYFLEIKYLNDSYIRVDGEEVYLGRQPEEDSIKSITSRKAIFNGEFVEVRLVVWG